jgi:8-oxo-dGTP diphosphatase
MKPSSTKNRHNEANPIQVAAAITMLDDLTLVARKRLCSRDEQGGRWEFPGGKCLQGESLEDCLKRELMEELEMRVEVKKPATTIDLLEKGRHFKIHFFWAETLQNPQRLNDHDRILWATWSVIQDLTLSKADRKAVERLSSC